MLRGVFIGHGRQPHLLGFVAKERSLVWALLLRKIRSRDRHDCCWPSLSASVVIEQCYAQDDPRDRRTHHSRHSDCCTAAVSPHIVALKCVLYNPRVISSYVHGCSTTPLLGETIGMCLDRICEKFADSDALISRH